MFTTPLLSIIQARIQQKYRTISYPKGDPPELPDRFLGKPFLKETLCNAECNECIQICPVEALFQDQGKLTLDLGRCVFCGACSEKCSDTYITFSKDFRLATSTREALQIRPGESRPIDVFPPRPLFKRSFKLRQVSAGGCNACEADCNVLSTVGWDLGRFGIQFVASPRHADGILVTGPVTKNMKIALEKTYLAVPSPKVVIAVGACAISGGPYKDHPEQHNGVSSLLPVDLYIPGCPPHPLTILEGLLRFLGRV
ncbi:MAG: hypothetical protein SNJ78_01825 [Spirochaetales bacterium]